MARHKQAKQKTSGRFTMISSGMGETVALAPGTEGDPPVTYDEVKGGFGAVKNKLAAKNAAAHLTEEQQAAIKKWSEDQQKMSPSPAEAMEAFTHAASKSAAIMQQLAEVEKKAAKLLAQGINNNTPGFLGPLAVSGMESSVVPHPSNVAMGDAFLYYNESVSGPVGEQATPPPPPQPDYLDNMLEDRHRADALEF